MHTDPRLHLHTLRASNEKLEKYETVVMKDISQVNNQIPTNKVLKFNTESVTKGIKSPLVAESTFDDHSTVLNIQTKFPDHFNPRKEANVHHKEKIDKWIKSVPAVPTNEQCDTWVNSCYNPFVPQSDESEHKNEELLDFGNSNDVIEFQSRLITYLTNKNYYNDMESVRAYDGKLIPGGGVYDICEQDLDQRVVHNLNQFDQYFKYNLS